MILNTIESNIYKNIIAYSLYSLKTTYREKGLIYPAQSSVAHNMVHRAIFSYAITLAISNAILSAYMLPNSGKYGIAEMSDKK